MYNCVKCCAMRAAVVIGMISFTAQADVIFVKADCDGGLGDGTSWADAHCGSQGVHDALARAVVGDEIWVGQGIYTPAVPGGDRTISFDIPSGVRVFGGFGGDETSADERDADVFLTVFSGDLNQDDIYDTIPFPTNPWENAYNVFTLSETDENTLVDSCTITSGFSSGRREPVEDRGGNFLVRGGSLTIRDCLIRYGYAETFGGGVSVQDGALTIDGCVFEGNYAATGGGAVAVYDGSSATIDGSSFDANIGGRGGSVFVGESSFTQPPTSNTSSARITDSEFANGLGLFGGAAGGAIMVNHGDLLATRCDFIDNVIPDGGGAVYLVSNEVRFESCRFFGNSADGDGGGAVYADGRGSIVPPKPSVFTNCLFVGNNGVVISNFDGMAEFVNCTMVNNTVRVSFLGWRTFVVQGGSTLVLHNSIVWNNDPFGDSLSSDNQFELAGNTDPILDIRNSIIQAWDGSIPGDAQAIDPKFVDIAGDDRVFGTLDDDVRLAADSPAIDMGNNALVRDDALDLDGNERVVRTVDLGAYEFQGDFCAADLTGDGVLNFFDISAFLNAFAGNDPVADFSGDGLFNFFDVSAFLNAFLSGCP